MGRYYYTNRTEGKFGFAVQPSDAPGEYFNMEEDDSDYEETGMYSYYIEIADFPLEFLKELFESCRLKFDLDAPTDAMFNMVEHTIDLCNLQLGITIYKDLLKDGECYLTAEM